MDQEKVETEQQQLLDEAPVAEATADEPEEIEVSNEELLGAVNEELTDVSTDYAKSEVPDEKDGEDDAGEEVAESKPEEAEPEAEPASEPEPEAKAEPEPEAPAEAAAEQPSDEFGSLEESVSEKTRERFETLKTRYDEMVAERDQIRGEADQWREAIVSTGTNPEQFGMALSWLQKINSGKMEDLHDAYSIMQNELAAVAKAIGKPVPGTYDPLTEHQDLKQRVDEGLLSEADAQEIAAARAAQNFNNVQSAAQREQETKQNDIQAALQDVRDLGAELQKSDPLFQQKMPYLEPIIASAVNSGAPPANWRRMIEESYRKLPAVPQVKPEPKPVPTPDPLRPTGATPSSGDMDKQPGSAVEAIDQALARGW